MRLADHADFPVIRRALARHEPTLRERGFVGTTDLEKAASSIESEVVLGNGYIVGDYLVMVTEITPWYNNDKLLQEWFTMSLKGVSRRVASIVPALVTIAKQRSCKLLVTGDTSGVLATVWKSHGLVPFGQSFFKGV